MIIMNVEYANFVKMKDAPSAAYLCQMDYISGYYTYEISRTKTIAEGRHCDFRYSKYNKLRVGGLLSENTKDHQDFLICR
ncbi:MAG: hypothetical protein ACLR43_03645 [Faecalibacillus faecis]